MTQGCFMDVCPDTVGALMIDDYEFSEFSERPMMLRDNCDPFAGSDLLSDEEFLTRFDPSIVTAPDTEEEWAVAWQRLDIARLFVAEMLYSATGSLPEAERERIRSMLRASVLAISYSDPEHQDVEHEEVEDDDEVEEPGNSLDVEIGGSGSLDEDSLIAVIQSHRRETRECYQHALQDEPELSGRVVIQFEIGADGRVDTAQLEDNEVGSEVGDCLVRRVQRWQFDAPSGGSVTVQQTFIFGAENVESSVEEDN